MEKDTFSGAILAWVKSAKAFLKVQAGTGDNLLEEDIREGFTDYCLWSTSRPESIDTDGELDMECLDSGMVLFRENCTPGEAGIELPASLRHRLRQGRLLRHPERNVVESKDPVGEASPCLQPLCPRVPQTVIPATFSRHPREGGDLLSNPRPNRLPDTPSPRSSAPKTPEPRAELLFQSLHDIHICG